LDEVVERLAPIGEAYREKTHQVEVQHDQLVAHPLVPGVGCIGCGGVPLASLDETREERSSPLAVRTRIVPCLHYSARAANLLTISSSVPLCGCTS